MITSEKIYIVSLFILLFTLVIKLLKQSNKCAHSYKIRNMKVYVLSINNEIFEEEKIRKKAKKLAKYTLDTITIPEDITSIEWNLIGKKIDENYDKYDSFVILHPMGSMAYSASGFSFMFENLNKSVILTGGNNKKKMNRNFLGALTLASYYNIPEVMTCVGGKILRGCRSTKVSDNLATPNYPRIGKVVNNRIILNDNVILSRPKEGFSFAPYNPSLRLGVVKMFPSIDGMYLKRFSSLDIMILETYEEVYDHTFLIELSEAIKKGVIVVSITQQLKNPIPIKQALELKNIGVISGRDMTTESALAKTHWLLSNVSEPSIDLLSGLIQFNLRGELKN